MKYLLIAMVLFIAGLLTVAEAIFPGIYDGAFLIRASVNFWTIIIPACLGLAAMVAVLRRK
jgi:hypothetical protein